MALRGSLQDMTVADLIQHNCLDRKTARLVVEHNSQEATLFFKEGSVTDATLGELQGEEVVYRVLSWQDGKFTLEMGLESPSTTIKRSWSGLLLEGARLLDEGLLFAKINGRSANTAPSQSQTNQVNEDGVKSEKVAKILANIVEGETDMEGAAVIKMDGAVYAVEFSKQAIEENNDLGTISATVWGLSKQSIKQLKRGDFNQTLIRGDQGNIIISNLNDEFIFVCLIPIDVNLGIVLSEARTVTEMLRSVL